MYERSSLTGYGLATFNLTRLTPHDVAYGHLGATYGYQSVLVYVPSLELSIAVATNIERDSQDQPADTFCSVYNTAKAIINGDLEGLGRGSAVLRVTLFLMGSACRAARRGSPR